MFREYLLRVVPGPGRETPSRPAKQIALDARRKPRIEHLTRPKPLI
jgi:hypothetical protein